MYWSFKRSTIILFTNQKYLIQLISLIIIMMMMMMIKHMCRYKILYT